MEEFQNFKSSESKSFEDMVSLFKYVRDYEGDVWFQDSASERRFCIDYDFIAYILPEGHPPHVLGTLISTLAENIDDCYERTEHNNSQEKSEVHSIFCVLEDTQFFMVKYIYDYEFNGIRFIYAEKTTMDKYLDAYSNNLTMTQHDTKG